MKMLIRKNDDSGECAGLSDMALSRAFRDLMRAKAVAGNPITIAPDLFDAALAEEDRLRARGRELDNKFNAPLPGEYLRRRIVSNMVGASTVIDLQIDGATYGSVYQSTATRYSWYIPGETHEKFLFTSDKSALADLRRHWHATVGKKHRECVVDGEPPYSQSKRTVPEPSPQTPLPAEWHTRPVITRPGNRRVASLRIHSLGIQVGDVIPCKYRHGKFYVVPAWTDTPLKPIQHFVTESAGVESLRTAYREHLKSTEPKLVEPTCFVPTESGRVVKLCPCEAERFGKSCRIVSGILCW